jgi:hypothetical protein
VLPRAQRLRNGKRIVVAAAVALVMTLVAWGLTPTRDSSPTPHGTYAAPDGSPTPRVVIAWGVRPESGDVRVDGCEINAPARLLPGVWMETRADATARVSIADIASMQVRPGSLLRIAASDESQHRIELVRGSIHAKVIAPPRLFIVDTPTVQAIDLGCEYTLDVIDKHTTRLHVLTGEVSLAGEQGEVVVPSGAVCLTRSKVVGTPRFVKSAADFQETLDAIDGGERADWRLREAIRRARDIDAMSLFALLERTPAGEVALRTILAEGIAALSGSADTAPLQGVIQGDMMAMAEWRASLEIYWHEFD